jgi:hypothetical protein
MKSKTTIDVQGTPQDVWEIYMDDTREQTFGFVFDEFMAELAESIIAMMNETPQEIGAEEMAEIDTKVRSAVGDGATPGPQGGNCHTCPFVRQYSGLTVGDVKFACRHPRNGAEGEREIGNGACAVPGWCPLLPNSMISVKK